MTKKFKLISSILMMTMYLISVFMVSAAPASQRTIAVIPDPALKAVLNETIATETKTTRTPTQDITIAELEVLAETIPPSKFGTISGANRNIGNLTGMEHLKVAFSMTLDGNKIIDLKPLTRLPKLDNISLSSNQISDITPLSTLPSVTNIAITDNKISDFSSFTKTNTWINASRQTISKSNADVLNTVDYVFDNPIKDAPGRTLKTNTVSATYNSKTYSPDANNKFTIPAADLKVTGDIVITFAKENTNGNAEYIFNGTYTQKITPVATLPPAIDKTKLDAKLNIANSLNESEYTADSWAKFVLARSAAMSVFADSTATQVQIDKALLDLNNAITNLVSIVPGGGSSGNNNPQNNPQTGPTQNLILIFSLAGLSAFTLYKFRNVQKYRSIK